jgi:hypothetical protein
MIFPLDFLDLSLFFAVIALILIVSFGLISSHQGATKILINKKKLENVTILFSVLFLLTVILRLFNSIF